MGVRGLDHAATLAEDATVRFWQGDRCVKTVPPSRGGGASPYSEVSLHPSPETLHPNPCTLNPEP